MKNNNRWFRSERRTGFAFHPLALGGLLLALAQAAHADVSLSKSFLDASSFFSSPVARADRSLMNVPFRLHDDKLDEAFLKGAQARGMVQLKGHRSVGGMRASIYNAMSIEGVQALYAVGGIDDVEAGDDQQFAQELAEVVVVEPGRGTADRIVQFNPQRYLGGQRPLG